MRGLFAGHADFADRRRVLLHGRAILAQAAAVIGKTDDAVRFNLLATNIATAFNRAYYSTTNGYYSTGSQTAQSLPLYLGIVIPTTRPPCCATRGQRQFNGPDLRRYRPPLSVARLADQGRSDLVFSLHGGTNNPGYGYILNQGATALTEAWDANPSDSQDHFMLGHITEWFYHDLAASNWIHRHRDSSM